MIEFFLPQTPGEWLAWLTALGTAVTGLALLLFPMRLMTHMGFALFGGRPDGLAELRGPIGGYFLGTGLVALALHPQPLVYLAIGAGYLFAVIGRLISILFDGARDGKIFFWLIVELIAAVAPLSYALGYIR